MTITRPLIRLLLESGDVEFTTTEIISARLIEQTSIVSTEIPINTLEFKVRTSDPAFSMFSDTYSGLKEKLPILAYEYVDDVARLLGKFYLEKWKNTGEDIIEFSAYDIIGVLADTDFDGAFTGDTTTLSEAIAQFLLPIGVQYEINADIQDVTIAGYNPPGKCRDALQQICFAAGATIITSRRENMLITPIEIPSLAYESRIRSGERLRNPTVELLPVVSRIEIVSHDYVAGETIETIFDKSLAAGAYKIVFDKPYSGVVVTGGGYTPLLLATQGDVEILTENGYNIEAGGEYNIASNAVYLSVETPAQVTITGYPFVDNKRSFIFEETETEEISNKKTILVSDATLIFSGIAQSILDGMRDYYRLRYSQKIRVLPTVDVNTGDIIVSDTLNSNRLIASVLKIESDLTRGFIAGIELRGKVPDFIPPAESPVRYARAGISVSGAGMTRNNSWRQYA
jgi:hypothetical protein